MVPLGDVVVVAALYYRCWATHWQRQGGGVKKWVCTSQPHHQYFPPLRFSSQHSAITTLTTLKFIITHTQPIVILIWPPKMILSLHTRSITEGALDFRKRAQFLGCIGIAHTFLSTGRLFSLLEMHRDPPIKHCIRVAPFFYNSLWRGTTASGAIYHRVVKTSRNNSGSSKVAKTHLREPWWKRGNGVGESS